MLAVQYTWNGQRQQKEITYPFVSTNSNGVRREVGNLEDHIAHALEPGKKSVGIFAKLYLAGVPIVKYISNNSTILHSIYIDTKRYGITYVYPTMDQTPAIVKWGLDIIGAEYQRLENQRNKQTQ